MTKEWSPWREGRRAWERLRSWLHDGAPAADEHDDGAAALNALSDVGLLRRLLDQAELASVRVARRNGRSWAEIATRLGVARQSAWEKWRELDESPGSGPAEPSAEAQERTAAEVIERAAMERRRRSTVTVPNVVGMSVDAARTSLTERGLVGVGSDPDDPSLPEPGTPGVVVTDQSPESGARVPSGTRVLLWVERGGGSGVREPRNPKPEPRFGRAMNDELSDEAVG